ncbi:MAG: lactate utilization protein [bacterium]
MDRIVEKTLKNLEKHHFDAHLFASAEDAKKDILNLLEEYDSFSFGGSMTLAESGLKDFIIANGKRHIERRTAGTEDEKIESERQSLLSDIYFCSANAISAEGALINIDKRGNRIGAMVFGPRKVVIVAGVNKLADTTEDAIIRAKNVASVRNCMRFNLDTPCVKVQRCVDCENENNICYTTVIMKRSFPHKRISVFLIEKDYGF